MDTIETPAAALTREVAESMKPRNRIRPTTQEHRKEIADYQEAVQIERNRVRQLRRYFVPALVAASVLAGFVGFMVGHGS
jgi:hypothetical protein